MNELQKYYINLDKSDYDIHSKNKINQELQRINAKFNEEGKFELLKNSELERIGFLITKSFDKKEDKANGTLNGLGWTTSGNKTLEDGSVEPFYWPNVTELTVQDFEYFEERYKKANNSFAKTEFGLLIYFGAKSSFSKHRDFKQSLFKILLDLSKVYLKRAKDPAEKNHYILDYIKTLENAFQLALKSKLNTELKEIIQHIYETHQNWSFQNDGTLRVLLDLSSITSENFKVFKEKIDFNKIISKNLEGAREIEKSNSSGAIYIINACIKIAKKTNRSYDDLLRYKAELNLVLSENAENNNNMASLSFTERALRLYQELKDQKKIQEVEKIYFQQRGKFKMATISQKFPESEIKRISEEVISMVNSFNDQQILQTIIQSPWFNTIDSVKKMAEKSKKQSPLLSLFGSSIVDKYGNTIEKFNTEEEKEKHRFWQSYGFNFQVGNQTMHKFFIEAYKANKISFKSVNEFLETTWFHEPITRNYNGKQYEVIPNDLVLPGIRLIFKELDNFMEDNNYSVDYVTITDSLVIKVETLLRNFCEKVGIPTFKTRQNGKDELIMEKLLDDLLADIKDTDNKPTGFDEEDRIFIKYVMSEKSGLNLRNQVAHGLLDIYEYTFPNLISVLCIILKLSKYKFVKR